MVRLCVSLFFVGVDAIGVTGPRASDVTGAQQELEREPEWAVEPELEQGWENVMTIAAKSRVLYLPSTTKSWSRSDRSTVWAHSWSRARTWERPRIVSGDGYLLAPQRSVSQSRNGAQ